MADVLKELTFQLDHALEHNTSLKKLDLSRNTQLVVVDGERVGCALERLNPSGFGITNCNEVATYLANGLAQNVPVRKLVLCSNQTSNACAVSIFRSLEHNTSLED